MDEEHARYARDECMASGGGATGMAKATVGRRMVIPLFFYSLSSSLPSPPSIPSPSPLSLSPSRATPWDSLVPNKAFPRSRARCRVMVKMPCLPTLRQSYLYRKSGPLSSSASPLSSSITSSFLSSFSSLTRFFWLIRRSRTRIQPRRQQQQTQQTQQTAARWAIALTNPAPSPRGMPRGAALPMAPPSGPPAAGRPVVYVFEAGRVLVGCRPA